MFSVFSWSIELNLLQTHDAYVKAFLYSNVGPMAIKDPKFFSEVSLEPKLNLLQPYIPASPPWSPSSHRSVRSSNPHKPYQHIIVQGRVFWCISMIFGIVFGSLLPNNKRMVTHSCWEWYEIKDGEKRFLSKPKMVLPVVKTQGLLAAWQRRQKVKCGMFLLIPRARFPLQIRHE